jgi:hypothetical protein
MSRPFFILLPMALMFVVGCRTEFFAFLVGQSCRSALKSWAAQQRRPTKDVKNFVLRPLLSSSLFLN